MEIDLRDNLPAGGKIDKAREYLKCKLSPLYFIENYIHIPVAGGMIPMKESDLWFSTPKYRQFINAIKYLDAVELMASRQHGKTTMVLAWLLWVILFHPKISIEYVTLDSKRANDAIKRMKEMLNALPEWLKIPYKGKSEKVTYIELENGSRMNSNYVSGAIDPDRLGRGMSAPLIYIDETAFIPKMDIVWSAMQPAISAARVFAKKNNYPNGIIFTTTPNGAGTNFFYNTWKRAWNSEEIFDGDSISPKEDFLEIMKSDENRNNFVKFRIHWSETNKNEEWYKQQVKELNFNYRKVSQELDLVFLGSSNAVFPDEVLKEFIPITPASAVTMAYGEQFNLYEEIKSTDLYLLGVDTAASTGAKADFCSMVLTHAKSGREVGSWHGKFSVVKRFAVVVKSLIQGLHSLHVLDEDTLTAVIERNSFGLGVIEELIYDDGGFNYNDYLYWYQQKNDKVPGFSTNAKSRDMMFNLLLSHINEDPTRVRSYLLQEELRNLEQKASGRFEATTGSHDDVVMAYNFTLFVRNELILEGVIEMDGRESTLDPKRLNYFLDASMTNFSYTPAKIITDPDKIEITYNIDEDEEKRERRRILSELGLSSNYQAQEQFDNFIIGL